MTGHSASISAPSSPLPAVAALAGAMVSITIGASIAKTLFPLVGPAGTTALRLLFAAILLAVVFRIWRMRLDRRMLLAAVPYGISLGCMNLLFYMAIQRIPLGVAIAVEFTGPLAVAIFFSRQRMDMGWIALAVLGLVLLLPLRLTPNSMDPVGIALALAAGVFWASYILTGKRAGDVLGIQASALGMIVAALVVLPFGIAEAGMDLLDVNVIAVALVVALLSSAIPYSLEMFALRRLPTKSFGILTSGEPAIGAVVGMILMGENLALVKWMGIGAIVLASIGVTLFSRPTRTVSKESQLLD